MSQGAQKNFAAFAGRMGKSWERNPDSFNEAWYREAVAKAIVFRTTERLVTEQPWYPGGYRANIVAYAIARIAHEAANRRCVVDFQGIWRTQTAPRPMRDALAVVAEAVHGVLVDPPEGISNVTEWAKKPACWKIARQQAVDLPRAFVEDLRTAADHRDDARKARREQRSLNRAEAQIAVVEAGTGFWAEALEWGRKRGLLTPTESGILGVAAGATGRIPSERQAYRAVETLRKLQTEGYPGELPDPGAAGG